MRAKIDFVIESDDQADSECTCAASKARGVELFVDLVHKGCADDEIKETAGPSSRSVVLERASEESLGEEGQRAESAGFVNMFVSVS
jgi:hypothetical protein